MKSWAWAFLVWMLQFGFDSRLLRIACIDVQPTRPNGQTVVLLHSNNFGAGDWVNILQALSAKDIALSRQKKSALAVAFRNRE